jgi:hypothetical protein
VTRNSDLQVLGTTPATTRGAKTVTWNRVDGLPTSATYTAVDARLDSITPVSGSIDGGAGPYQLAGAGFTNGIASLTLGGVTIPSANYTLTSDALLTINTLPAGVTFGQGDVTLTMTSGDVITIPGGWFWLPGGVTRHLVSTTLTSGAVATMSDLSGHGRDATQATGGNQGTVGTSAVVKDAAGNGIKCLLFSKANSTVYGCSDAAYAFTTRPFSVVAVVRPNNGQPTGQQWAWQGGPTTNTTNLWALGWPSNTRSQWDFPNTLNGGSVGTADLPIMFIGVQDTTGHLWWENDTLHSDANAANKLPNKPVLGSSATQGAQAAPIDMELFEIIEWQTKKLSTAETDFLRLYRTKVYNF